MHLAMRVYDSIYIVDEFVRPVGVVTLTDVLRLVVDPPV